MVKVKIIRHSERLDYKYPWYWIFCVGYYWSDSPLTSNGHKLAYNKGLEMQEDNFNPKIIYTSPYNRTLETSAEIGKIFPESKISVEFLLSEYQPGYKQRVHLYPEGIPTSFNGCLTKFSFPETETLFTERVEFIINQLIEKNNNDFIIVTHGEVLKQFIIYLQNIYLDLKIGTCEVPYLTTLSFEYDEQKQIVKETIKIR